MTSPAVLGWWWWRPSGDVAFVAPGTVGGDGNRLMWRGEPVMWRGAAVTWR